MIRTGSTLLVPATAGLVTLVALVCLATPTFAEKEREPLPIEAALSALSFVGRASIQLSPDGQWVAYTLQDPRRKETPKDKRYLLFTRTGVSVAAVGTDIWITHIRSGETKNLTGGRHSNWGPVWSPDGKYLAFYSDRDGLARLWLWERSTRKLRRISDLIVRPLFTFELVRWTPDSRKVLVKVLPEGMTLEEATDLIIGPPKQPEKWRHETESTAVVFSSPAARKHHGHHQPEPDRKEAQGFGNRSLADLALIDVASGTLQRIARGVKPLWYGLSPDGSQAAFTSLKGNVEHFSQQLVYDLVVVSLTTGSTVMSAPAIQQTYGISVSWSPDGKWLSYTTAGTRAKGNIFLVPVEGGEPHKATESAHPSFAADYRAPLWDARGETLYFLAAGAVWKVSLSDRIATEVTKIADREILEIISPAGGGRFWSPDGGRSTVVRTRDNQTKQSGFYKIDLATGQTTQLLEEPKIYGGLFSTDVSRDSKRVVYLIQDASHSPDLWTAGPDFQHPRRLTRINPQFDNYPMGRSRLIEWRDADGRTLQGALLLPADYEEGKRYPLVVNVYGGSSRSNSVNRFGLQGVGVDNLQILATRGYAVLLPDAPLRVGTPMKDLAKTVLPGVNKAIELGIADPVRIGVMGHSYGGYSTLALIVQSTIFKAAVASGSLGNLISYYAHKIGWSEEGQGRMGGSPWEYRERYIENSPFFYLDRVETPLLLVHGSLDRTVPRRLSEAISLSLGHLDKEVEYVRYEGEPHWQGRWGFANRVDYWKRVIAWFDEHLKEPEEKKPRCP